MTSYKTLTIEGLDIFYREAGSPDDWVYVGRFKNLDTLGEFIKVTRPFAASRSIS